MIAAADMLPWLGGALLRPLATRTFATAAAAASSGPHFCIVGSGPAGFYTADKVRTVKSQRSSSLSAVLKWQH